MTARGALVILLLSVFPVAAADPPMICFGNEPSWGLHFADPGNARLQLPDAPPVEYRGSATRLEVIHERAWRGRAATGGGDLVAFLRDAVCSDGMSDTKHPVIARVSLADGRLLAGCCRMVPATTAAPVAATSIEGPIWRLTDLRGLDPRVLRDAVRPVTATFKAGRISGFSGCNQFFGPYTLDRDRVAIGPLAGSLMACEEPSMTVEKAVHAALTGTFRYVLAEHRLTLLSGTEPVLTLQEEAAPTLEGVTWTITGFNNGRQAVVSPLSGTTLSLTFKGGRVRDRRVQHLPRDVHRRGGSHRDRARGAHAHGLRRRWRHAAGAGVPVGIAVGNDLGFHGQAARHASCGRRARADGRRKLTACATSPSPGTPGSSSASRCWRSWLRC